MFSIDPHHAFGLALLASLSGAQLVFLLGFALLIFILLMRGRRYFRRQRRMSAVSQASSQASPSTATLNTPEHRRSHRLSESEAWEVQMRELARELTAEVNTRAAILEQYIRLADDAAARLEIILDRSERVQRGEANSLTPGEGSRPSEASLDASTTADTTMADRAGSASLSSDPRFARIYALADAGLSPARIASQIATTVGEVELILSLRGRG